MCEQKFSVCFKLNIGCVDATHCETFSLIAKRKGMSVIPPIGMHIMFNKFDVEVTGISAPFSFDVVTCRCQIFKPLTYEQVMELLKLGWKEDLKQGEVSKFKPIDKIPEGV